MKEKRITLVICAFGFAILSKLYGEDLTSLVLKLHALASVTFYLLESLTCNKNK